MQRNDHLRPGQVIAIYAGIINSDGNEGRGHDVVVGYYWSEATARRAVKGQDTMGSDGKVKSVSCVVDEDRMIWVDGKIVTVMERLASEIEASAVQKLADGNSLSTEELEVVLDSKLFNRVKARRHGG